MKETSQGSADECDEDDSTSDAFLRAVARVDEVAPPEPPAGAGEKVGRFRIVEELGRGGMGIVYLAVDEKLRRRVALKVLPKAVTQDDRRRRRFLREARAAAAVNHPNLVTIYDVAEVDGRIYIAMELLQGRTLRAILSSRRLPLDEVLDIAGQILLGLAKAHEKGIVHRDLKPDNVLVTEEGVAKVLDFGLAKYEGPPGNSLGNAETLPADTREGCLLGTPGYMSPEQARGKEADHRSDIFSFGVVVYEMLTGSRPFHGETGADEVSATLRDAAPPVSALRPDVPRALARAVERCLEKEPGARYQDCAEVAIDLGGRVDSRRARGTSLPSSISGTGASHVVEAPRGARRYRVTWGLLAVLSAGAFILGVSIVRGQRPGVAALPARSARPVSTAVTDLPLPTSKSPEAVSAYAAAMQAFRDGNWGYAHERLRRAVVLDPSLAAAHLRLAITLQHGLKFIPEARESFAHARNGRATLSERDQVLLNAFEPLLSRDPPDREAVVKRLREATARYPGDAELFGILAYATEMDPELGLLAANRSVQIDPEYADGWQAVGKNLFKSGKTDEALEALGRCISISSAAADCWGERGEVNSAIGRCADAEEDFRRAIASSTGPSWHDPRAAVLQALGRPEEAVLEVLRQKWSLVPDGERRVAELEDQSHLDIAAGRFDRALECIKEIRRLLSANPDGEAQARYAAQMVRIYLETNRAKDAAQVADDYLKRKAGWRSSTTTDAFSILMTTALFRGGVLREAEFARKRDEWLGQRERFIERSSAPAWLNGIASIVETESDAALVLDALSKGGAPSIGLNFAPLNAALGKLYLLAGRTAEALSRLKPAVRGCNTLYWPLLHTEASWMLGQALERTSDRAGACEAYSLVIRRWGSADPPSFTAAKARARAAALACK